MKKLDFRTLVMLLCVASMSVFFSCDNKGNEPDDPTQGGQTEQNGSSENNGGEETPTPEEPVTFTLTLLSSNEAMGTVTEGGTYNKDAEVIIEATATKEACMFVKWSDGNTENPRTLTMTENIKLTAEFDYAYVDLGLPSGLKWATCNVGADSVHHYGDHYAWGETEPKTVYEWSNYFDTTDGGTTFLKYSNEGGKTTLDPEDDAATVNMGGSWRMPTKEELEELKTECTWTWCENYNETGERGYIVNSKTNSNSIFLPSAGYIETTTLKNHSEHAYYSSSSLDETASEDTHVFFYSSGSIFFYSGSRYSGHSVRGVFE